MSSSWILKTRQMSEAGKATILSQALANHLRSPRDRKLVTGELKEKHSLEDLLSLFGAFYLYSYQGIRLLHLDASQDLSIEEREALTKKEHGLLENEVRMMLGNKQREEIHVSRISSEFTLEACSTLEGSKPKDSETMQVVIDLIRKYANMIPSEYSHNSEIDFITEITGWAAKWRDEIYVKASGLKESSLSLRDELLKPHDEEVAEIAVLKRGIEAVKGSISPPSKRVLSEGLSSIHWNGIAEAVIDRLFSNKTTLNALKLAHGIRLSALNALVHQFDSPTTLEDYETLIGRVLVQSISDSGADSKTILEAISHFVGIPLDDVSAFLRVNGIRDTSRIAEGLVASASESRAEEIGEAAPDSSYTPEQIEEMTRSLRKLEKLEDTLEKPVKGLLRSKGLRASELDSIHLDFLTKDRSTLLGFEIRVLEELERKTRVPDPEEVKQLIQLRTEFQSGKLTGAEISSSMDMTRQLQEGKSFSGLRMDLIWYFTIGILKNLVRVIETYNRSKYDIQRSKALLKSIYEDSDTQLQFLREEILIDLLSMRLAEIKIVHPELNASNICAWYHARLTNTDIESAKVSLDTSPSPVFWGVKAESLNLRELSFDNYSIAFDLMQRFLVAQRSERDIRIEQAAEAKTTREKQIEDKKSSVDVFSFIYTKSHTVFRAIGRVGAKGLEWNANDDAKCANLLSFFLKNKRGIPICGVCGESSADGVCSAHGKGNMTNSTDVDNLSWFVKRAISDIKEGLIGAKSEPLAWSEARSIVQRELGILRRRGKLTSRTNVNAMLPGEINYIVGPALAAVIGKYFNESLEYAARRAGIA
ncbi:MAG: hypothetical protein ACFFEF_05775 [Candidatus Thorarchaeota archaeon]